jgi:dTDP-4-dehydrorhamnose reductase
MTTNSRVLVLGATGMLGHAVLRYFRERNRHTVFGSVRSQSALALLPTALHEHVIVDVDVEDADGLSRVFATSRPDIVINCIGLVKQLANANDPLAALPINSLLPHRLARECDAARARLVHISTDCVFTGAKGMYRETDTADARDLYGLSKYLGEVDYPHAITLRTSIIGHELRSAHGLIEWFLAQTGRVQGYARAVFSGLPTVELARVIHDVVIPRSGLRGVYHVSAAPIDKYQLLRIVAQVYGVTTEIVADERLVIDRSLDSSRFRSATGFEPAAWPALVSAMHAFR